MYYKQMYERFQSKISAAVELQYEKIMETIEKDYITRFEALEAWDGLGMCPVQLVQWYTLDLKNGVLEVCVAFEGIELLKIGLVNQSVMAAKLHETGWEKVNETTYKLV